MKRNIIIASHSNLAKGLADTLNFVSGGIDNLTAIAAYVDGKPIDEAIDAAMAQVAEDDELIILTDMTGGSVNQHFFGYRTRPHTHVISGVNLPLAFALAMESTDEYLTEDEVRDVIASAKEEMKYINDISVEEDEDDE